MKEPALNLTNKVTVLAHGFAQIPVPILAMTEISSSAKLVWAALCNRARPGGGGKIYPTLSTIAADTGLSRRTVMRAIGELIAVKPSARRDATTKKDRETENADGMLGVTTHHEAPNDYFIYAPDWIFKKYCEKTEKALSTRCQHVTGGGDNMSPGVVTTCHQGSDNMAPKEEKVNRGKEEKGKAAAAAETSPLEGVEVDALANQLKDLPGNPHTNAQYLLNQIATLLATADSFGPPPTRVAIITTARKAAKDLVTWNNREPLRSFKRAAHCVAIQVVSAPAEKKHTRHGIHHYEEDQ
jgi:hypothetical protein